MITYRYAYDCHGNHVDVTALTKKLKTDQAPFNCFGCGNELIPRLGKLKAKHFAHKQNCTCSGETYLHELAKQTFCTAFNDAVANGTPVWLDYIIYVTCTGLQHIDHQCNKRETKTIDLTRFFNKAEQEAKHKSFRADVLLTGEHKTMMVEIMVTHECSYEKKHSGVPIIEIKIHSESDIEHLKNCDFKVIEEKLTVRRYGFLMQSQIKDTCNGDCPSSRCAAILYKNAKYYLGDANLSWLNKGVARHSVAHYEFAPPTGLLNLNNKFLDLNKIAKRKSIIMRCCLNCKYQSDSIVDEYKDIEMLPRQLKRDEFTCCTGYKKMVRMIYQYKCKYYKPKM